MKEKLITEIFIENCLIVYIHFMREMGELVRYYLLPISIKSI